MQGVVTVIDRLGNSITQLEAHITQLAQERENLQAEIGRLTARINELEPAEPAGAEITE